jgi:hypothetical protein
MKTIDNRGTDKERGPRSEIKAEVETSFALPKTLQAETQLMPIGGATIPMFAVYGKSDDGRRVWVATFVDSDEAQAWVRAGKVFGRAVKGAVIADQKPAEDDEQSRRDAKIAQIRDDLATGKLVKVDHEDGSASLYDGPNADKSN